MTINMAGGLPDPRIFPRSFYSDIPFEPSFMIPGLDREIKKVLSFRGINVSTDEFLLTTGSIQGIFLFSRTILNPGDRVAVEYPTFAGALRVFKSVKVSLVKLPVIPYYDLRLPENVKVVYVIPTGQNPTGINMRIEEKKALLEMAEEKDFLILEDDAYGFLNPEEPTLKSMDRVGRVVYLTTFSKVLSPGLRLGLMVAHEDLIREFIKVKENVDGRNSSVSMALLYQSLRDNSFWEGLTRAKRIYEEKKDIMAEALDKFLPNAEWSYPQGGLFFFVRIKGINSGNLLNKVKDDVVFMPGAKFFFDNCGLDYFRLSFSYSSPPDIEKGIEIISKNIDSSELYK